MTQVHIVSSPDAHIALHKHSVFAQSRRLGSWRGATGSQSAITKVTNDVGRPFLSNPS